MGSMSQQGSGSLQGLLYQSMASISQCSLALQQQLLELAKGYADVMTQTTTQFMNTAFSAAEDAGKAMRDKSWGDLASGVVGMAGTAGTIGSAYNTSTGGLETELDNLGTLETKLKGGGGSMLDIADDELENFASGTDGNKLMNEKLKGWSASPDNFKNVDLSDETTRAAAQLSDGSEGHDSVLANLKSRQDTLKGEIGANRDSFQKTSSGIHVATQAGTSISNGIAGIFQAGDQQSSAEAQAESDVLKQLGSSLGQNQQSAISQANEEKQAAQQASLGYGSMQQTHSQ